MAYSGRSMLGSGAPVLPPPPTIRGHRQGMERLTHTQWPLVGTEVTTSAYRVEEGENESGRQNGAWQNASLNKMEMENP